MKVSQHSLYELNILPKTGIQKLSLVQLFAQNCVSAKGAHLVRLWFENPLSDLEMIRERQKAIEFFIENKDLSKELRKLLGLASPGFDVLRNFFDKTKPIFGFSRSGAYGSKDRMNKMIREDEEVQRKEEIPRLLKVLRSLNEAVQKLETDYFNFQKHLFASIYGEGQIEATSPYAEVQQFIRTIEKVEKDKVIDALIEFRAKSIMDDFETEKLLFQIEFLGLALWEIDVVLAFAATSIIHDLSCPSFLDEPAESSYIHLEQCWNPLLNVDLPSYRKTDVAVKNDFSMDSESSICLITGPNAGGKSVFMKTVGINLVLAHIGSFVPARDMRTSLFDHVLTCIYPQDDIASGESSFIWQQRFIHGEILAKATNRSMIILDEIASGTSGYRDGGEALAAGFMLYIHKHLKSFCLFATHFEHLPHIPEEFGIKGIRNIHPEKDKRGWSTFKMVDGKGKSDGLEAAQNHIKDFNDHILDYALKSREKIREIRKKLSKDHE